MPLALFDLLALLFVMASSPKGTSFGVSVQLIGAASLGIVSASKGEA